MKRPVLPLLPLAIAASCGGPPSLDPPGGVVRMSLSDGADVSGVCTAWRAAPDLVVSAGHCALDPTVVPGVKYTLGPEEAVAEVLVDDDVHDVSVFRGHVDGPSLRVADSDPAIGEAVWTAGYGHGFYGMSTGFWAGRSMGKGLVSIVAAGGMSGSPVMNVRGEVVGVLVSGFRGSSTTFVVPVEDVRRALRQAATVRDRPSEPVVPTED